MNALLNFRYDPRPSDCEAVGKLVRETGFFSASEADVAVELVTERLDKGETLSGYSFVFAESDGGLAGYSCYGPIACTEASYDLFWIAVESSQQRAGIGRQVLLETEQRIQASGGKRIYVETSGRAQYVPTRAFYERCGYQCEAVLVDFYGPGDAKHIYVKAVSKT